MITGRSCSQVCVDQRQPLELLGRQVDIDQFA
jgi:hypothetical protein